MWCTSPDPWPVSTAGGGLPKPQTFQPVDQPHTLTKPFITLNYLQRWREQEPGQAPLPARLPLQRDDGGAVEPAARGQDELGRTRPQLRPRLGGAASQEELWLLPGENRMVGVNSGFITLGS